MPIRIKRRKQDADASSRHKNYMGGVERTWIDDEREENGSDMRKTFWRIIILSVIILVILITSIVAANITSPESQNQTITASDTFAVSQREQNQMINTSQTFARAMLTYAYCNDPVKAEEARQVALSFLANNTKSYEEISALDGNIPLIAYENLAAVVTDPIMTNGSQSYAGSYVYELDGAAADTSITSSSSPDGTFVDKGYHFIIKFELVSDESTGENVWVISNCSASKK